MSVGIYGKIDDPVGDLLGELGGKRKKKTFKEATSNKKEADTEKETAYNREKAHKKRNLRAALLRL